MRGVPVHHVVSPEKQESWDVNEQLFAIFQLRKAENTSVAKQGWNQPSLEGGRERGWIGNQAEAIRMEDPSPRKNTNKAVSLGWFSGISKWVGNQVRQRCTICSKSQQS